MEPLPSFFNVPPEIPIDCPSDEEAHSDFRELCAYTPRLKQKSWESRSEGLEKVHDYVLPIDRVGTKSSNRYHYSARMACGSVNSPSVVRSWYIAKFRKGLEASKFYEQSPRTALAMRKYIPAQFRPASAIAVYDLFGAKRIYDPCMGWGDRLSGALAYGAEVYYGRDVNPFLFGGFSEQVKNYRQGGTSAHFEMVGSELSCPAENYFDLAFTSPPYFKVEKYAGKGQSHEMFKTLDKWLEGFLFKMAENAFTSVRDGGYVVLNISDVYCDHRVNVICHPLIDFMGSIGATYMGAIGYELGKRINHNNTKSSGAGFSEPVLVFGKKPTKNLQTLIDEFVVRNNVEL